MLPPKFNNRQYTHPCCPYPPLRQVWDLLGNGIYNSPKEKIQQGTHESVFCARPGLDVYQVSSWSEMKEYYNPQDVIEAARLMVSVADKYQGNNNFEFDLLDVLRQALAEKGRLLQSLILYPITSIYVSFQPLITSKPMFMPEGHCVE